MASVLFKRGQGYEEKHLKGLVVRLRATQGKGGDKDWRAGRRQADRCLEGDRERTWLHPQKLTLEHRDWHKAEHPNRLTHACTHIYSHTYMKEIDGWMDA